MASKDIELSSKTTQETFRVNSMPQPRVGNLAEYRVGRGHVVWLNWCVILLYPNSSLSPLEFWVYPNSSLSALEFWVHPNSFSSPDFSELWVYPNSPSELWVYPNSLSELWKHYIHPRTTSTWIEGKFWTCQYLNIFFWHGLTDWTRVLGMSLYIRVISTIHPTPLAWFLSCQMIQQLAQNTPSLLKPPAGMTSSNLIGGQRSLYGSHLFLVNPCTAVFC